MSAPASWAELSRAREEVRRRWPSVFDLPVVRRRFPFLASHLAPEGTLLEVGAAERPFDGRLKEAFPRLVHRTVDPDPAGRHDFRDLSEVREPHDVVVAWEVVEHLPLEALPAWLSELRRLTRRTLIVSTPNVYLPGQYWKDLTHRTPLAYTELGALLVQAGFKVASLHRTYHAGELQYWARRVLAEPLHRLMGVDYARSVVAVAVPA